MKSEFLIIWTSIYLSCTVSIFRYCCVEDTLLYHLSNFHTNFFFSLYKGIVCMDSGRMKPTTVTHYLLKLKHKQSKGPNILWSMYNILFCYQTLTIGVIHWKGSLILFLALYGLSFYNLGSVGKKRVQIWEYTELA